MPTKTRRKIIRELIKTVSLKLKLSQSAVISMLKDYKISTNSAEAIKELLLIIKYYETREKGTK